MVRRRRDKVSGQKNQAGGDQGSQPADGRDRIEPCCREAVTVITESAPPGLECHFALTPSKGFAVRGQAAHLLNERTSEHLCSGVCAPPEMEAEEKPFAA